MLNAGVNNDTTNITQVTIASVDPSMCVKEAKKCYEATLEGAYTIDNTKTENSHLDLLHRLFPKNGAVKEVAKWFKRKRLATYPETESNKNKDEEIKDLNKSRSKDHRR